MPLQPAFMYRQSGVVPFRHGDGGLEVLLVRNRNDTKWICPKGVVENGMTEEQSAANEAREEAGVLGEVHSVRLGTYRQKKWGGVCTINMYPMTVTQVLNTWLEINLRKRAWFPVAEASDVCDKAIRDIVAALPDVVGSG